jgi:mono/diheme cytochrome c family protein
LLKSDEEFLRTIEHGVVFSPMHSWRGQLSDDEMTDVVAYIRRLLQQRP